MARIIGVAILGGLAAAQFARLCDGAMHWHSRLYAAAPLASLVLLPVGFPIAAWLTRRFAPEAAGSGIPQVIAAAEERWHGRWGGQRVTLKTAVWKVALSAALLVCGASIGREGPTVQVVAGVMRTLTRGLKGGPGRRAIIIAGGAAGVAAAFNTPIAGVVFALEELAKSFERRTHTTVIMVVVIAGLASYALQGDYAYFGVLNGASDLKTAWLAAPFIGVVGGLAGGVFSRALSLTIGPDQNPLTRWRRAHPIIFATLCGGIAAGAAFASGGITFGAGYAEAKSLLQGHPGRGLGLAGWKFVATLAAAASGAPGGLFAPSLAIGAGLGAAFAHTGLAAMAGRDAVVLGMCSYLSGVVQAPLTSAVILMEMTRNPGLVGPLMLAALLARASSAWVMPEPIYHALSRSWRLAPG
ncbi:chloride channel protein [Phenylobacterium montanum]|uniref:Chloride channel protein n=1 Tax=Phenylobacterium montanum TaxID=2823693 RepID=A0A975IW56_9CAUL|nr:chloride channel protein [Caulobacter sp. S6]QUD89523.1 chloride channel protein [Caulobacter sp. S6]